MYKVTVIIPVYNVAAYIEDSLLSAFNQTYDNIEYLIIDDCGTDNSISIAEDIIKSHKRKDNIKIIRHECNKGLSAARNTGIENAAGDYVYFMDSDDEITSDCIEKLCNAAAKQNSDIVFGNIRLVGADSIHIKNLQEKTITGKEILKDFLKRKYNIAAVNKLYKKSFLDSNCIKFVQGILHEDFLFSFQCCKNADVINIMPEYTSLYKVRNNSISQSKVSLKRINDLSFIIDTFKLSREQSAPELKSSFDKYIHYLVFLTSLQLLKSELSDDERKRIYKNLRADGLFFRLSAFAVLNLLPYPLFVLFVGSLYSIYKK